MSWCGQKCGTRKARRIGVVHSPESTVRGENAKWRNKYFRGRRRWIFERVQEVESGERERRLLLKICQSPQFSAA